MKCIPFQGAIADDAHVLARGHGIFLFRDGDEGGQPLCGEFVTEKPWTDGAPRGCFCLHFDGGRCAPVRVTNVRDTNPAVTKIQLLAHATARACSAPAQVPAPPAREAAKSA